MSNVVTLSQFRIPAPSSALATEFGADLHQARKDPSDPEECQVFLLDLYPHRVRDVLANLSGAMDLAGQMYLDAVNSAVTEEIG